MPTLYDFMGSGNGYKVRLLLAQLGLPYRLVECDILKGETRTPAFLAKNPNGRIPTLELDDGTILAESDAILWYLAEGTPFAPADRLARAQTLQWMFFEQYSHEPYIAVVRFWRHFLTRLSPLQQLDLPERVAKGQAALGVMEQHLARHPFFVGDRYGIADIALYAYTHVAPEGGFDLDPYPHVCAWMGRVAGQPGYVPMDFKSST
ncbi:MAG: glutathione S-transferase family protein [Reyranellaceae bacterium]